MALNQMIEGFQPSNDLHLLNKAAALSPTLLHSIAEPVRAFRNRIEDETIALCDLPQLSFGKGDRVCLDFGIHRVGRITLDFSSMGSHPDAPAYLRLRFSEIRQEMDENPACYKGWLSRSWIQEELIHVDNLTAILSSDEFNFPCKKAERHTTTRIERIITKSITYIGMDIHTTNYTPCCYCVEDDQYFSEIEIKLDYHEVLKYVNRIKTSEERELRCCAGMNLDT